MAIQDEPHSSIETQRALATIWAEVLAIDEATLVGCSDFLALGGDSLDASECMIAVEDKFGVRLPTEALIGETATLNRMAAMIDAMISLPR